MVRHSPAAGRQRNPRLEFALRLHVLDFDTWDEPRRAEFLAAAVADMHERGYVTLPDALVAPGAGAHLGDHLVDEYLELRAVASLIDVAPKTAGKYRLPAPDAMIGTVRGWRASTILRWDARRQRKPSDAERAVLATLEVLDREYEAEHGEPMDVTAWLVARDELLRGG